MIKKQFSLFLLLIFSCSAFAQWRVESIPELLLKNSDVVVRRYATEIKVYEYDRIEIAENLVLTVMGKDALNSLFYCCVLNDSTIGKSSESRVYDFNGKRVKGIKVILKYDNSSKRNRYFITLSDTQKILFPLTVEIEYKRLIKNIYAITLWKPVADYRNSVQYASLRLAVCDTSFITFQCNGLHLVSKNIDNDGLYVKIWELLDFKSKKKGSSQELPLNDLPELKFLIKE